MVIPLDAPLANLANAGGKGRNLAQMLKAGFSVPGGFIVTTDAYRVFVEVNDLESFIHRELDAVSAWEISRLDIASDRIRKKFSQGVIPLILETTLKEAHLLWEHTPLAVRSSATAEDLPEASFAGQQETFLNVIGYEETKKAIVDCWSSLWTARAIAYRARNDIPQRTVALAVVVQEMVPADVSGIVFTANPLNGTRTELVVDAIFGLGEALVSGQVEPDHFVVEKSTGRIIERRIGSKAIEIVGQSKGGVRRKKTKSKKSSAAISDEVVGDLATIAEKVEMHFGVPQDIEWAMSEGRIFLLQSRPITTLYPLPDLSPDPIRALFSFGAVQGMLDPLTPLGQDAIKLLIAGGASLLGYHVTHNTQDVIHEAGERLWGNVTPLIQNRIGKRILINVLQGIEPGSLEFFQLLVEDPRFRSNEGPIRLNSVRRFLHLSAKIGPAMIRNLINPERSRKTAQRKSERFVNSFGIRARAIAGEPDARLKQRVALFETLIEAFPFFIPTLAVAVVAGLLPYKLIYRMGIRAGIERDRLLELFRGLPHNTTTEMDLALWQTARAIRDIPEARKTFLSNSPGDITTRYQEHRLPPEAQTAISLFLERYGMRGVAEIDIGRLRWNEDPYPVIQTLQGYLKIPKRLAPDIAFRQGEIVAAKAREDILDRLRTSPRGLVKKAVAVWAIKRFKALAGLRESPKYFIMRFMWIIRQALLESGTDLAMSAHLERREDIFFLYLSELKDLSEHKLSPEQLQELIRPRKARYRLEMRRKQIPRVLLSNGQVFYEMAAKTAAKDQVITGSPVSPGVVEGVARLITDPGKSVLKPGEIIICKGTDPAWTPLFLTAGGLVMEVGGLMTHGSVVAREYGIPAVVGVHQATEILQTGMRVRVDGSAGTITPL